VDAATGEITAPPAPPTIDTDHAEQLVAKLKQLVDGKVWTSKDVKLNLAAAGATDTSTVTRAVATLQVKQATQLEQHADTLLAKQEA
jgi:hypothetical protein